MIEAVLFDMDGVLFDTERCYGQIEHELVAQMGYDAPQDLAQRLCGANYESVRRELGQMFGESFDGAYFISEVHRRLFASLAQQGVPKKPGLDATLEWLRGKGLPMAVASSSVRDTVSHHLEATGTKGYFDVVVAGDMVRRSKPEPDIFLEAAAALGIKPQNCLVVEDSYNGVRAGAAAGCITVMIPDVLPPTDEMRQLAAAVLPGLDALPEYILQSGLAGRGATPQKK